MPDMLNAINAAIEQTGRAVNMLAKKKADKVNKMEEREYLKAVCLSWLKTHRADIVPVGDLSDLSPIDGVYQAVLEASEGRPLRKALCDQLRGAKKRLVSLRSKLVLIDPKALNQDDKAPQFSKLAPDPEMQDILLRRWEETLLCMRGNANLAATVMMGGLLEALLLGRVNFESNKKAIFTATAAPKDKSTGNALQLKDWGLKDYIDVAHELGWITKSAKDVGEVLRDYRNYIHPHKEHAHKVKLSKNDALILWGVAKSIAIQVIASVV